MVARASTRLAARREAVRPLNAGGLSRGRLRERAVRPRPRRVHRRPAGPVGRFELADGGTLFLDEIGNVPLSQQGKLLRVLETGEFERVGSSRDDRADARVLSATNADLAPRWPPAASARTSCSG
jgi:transcriptional regulator of aromatic amino acid metabolism